MTVVKKVAPPTARPERVAVFRAELKSSPFHVDVAKVISAVTPKADVEVIIPLIASYERDSIVPALAIFLACSYVK